MTELRPKAAEATNILLGRYGVAPLHGGTVYDLLRDHWASRINAATDYQPDVRAVLALAERNRAAIYSATIAGVDGGILAGDGKVLVLALKSLEPDEIKRRAQALGLKCDDLQTWTPPAEAPKPAAPTVDEPPAHFCLARTRWYETHGLKDPKDPRQQEPAATSLRPRF